MRDGRFFALHHLEFSVNIFGNPLPWHIVQLFRALLLILPPLQIQLNPLGSARLLLGLPTLLPLVFLTPLRILFSPVLHALANQTHPHYVQGKDADYPAKGDANYCAFGDGSVALSGLPACWN